MTNPFFHPTLVGDDNHPADDTRRDSRDRRAFVPRLATWASSLSFLVAYPVSTAMAQPPDPAPSRAAIQPRDTDEPIYLDEVAEDLHNPLSRVTRVPLENNFDFGLGSADAFRYTLNIQPIIPFALSREVNVTSRTILPIAYQGALTESGDGHGGLGDLQQSFFFGPSRATTVKWGAGPALLIPTATSDATGRDQWALGPTAVVLVQPTPWTAGALIQHVWSFAGGGERVDVNETFFQPFVVYTTPTAMSFSASFEALHQQARDSWSVPVVLTTGQVFRLADQLARVDLAGKYWLAGPEVDPAWGLRLTFTVVVPGTAS